MTTTTATKKNTLSTNDAAILRGLEKGLKTAPDLLGAKGVTIGRTSIYAKLGKLKDRGLVLRKVTKKSKTSTKGDRVEFTLSAKGKKTLAKL